jgi:signal transduction histidine kinase/CheY-like chemotaxis protein
MTETSERPPLASKKLVSKLTQMKRQPFGALEDGSLVEEIKGSLLIGSINYMQEVVAAEAGQTLPADISDEEGRQRIQEAQREALDRLVEMLNAAQADERYHVTADYILDESNSYTTEFWLFTVDYCRVICGDPDFYRNSSQGRIPPILVRLFSPLSTSMIFQLLPQIASKLSNTDLRAVEVTPTSAKMRWYGRRQDDPTLNEIHLTVSSLTIENLLVSIPEQIRGAERPMVVQTSSMLDGSDYGEWEFTWRPSQSKSKRWLWLGGLISISLLGLYLWVGIPEPLLLIVAILSPLLLGWSIERFKSVEYDHGRKEYLLQEQRNLAEEQYDQSHEVKAQLQSVNVELSRKVDEFTALHDISMAISSTLDLDELIQRSLEAVTRYLHFDRALVLIVDEERQKLTRGHGVGGSAELQEVVGKFDFSLDDPDNYFVTLLRSDEARLISEIPEDAKEINYQLAQAFGTQEHLGAPLISKGRRVGILIADNGLSQRPISHEEVDLIFVVAGQIAVAIDNAQLYVEVESQKRTLEQRVEQRTRELAQATAEAQEARAIAEEANEAKSTFLSNVSHELRTPLTSVLGFTKVIQKSLNRQILPQVKVDSPRVERAITTTQENLQIIVDEGERLTALINDVLDLAKIEAGKIEWEVQKLQMATVIDRALASTASLIEEKQLRFISEVEEDLPEIIGDRNKLIQVLINLISNAVKFTRGGTVICRALARDDEVIISVIDNGIGIAEKDQEQLFAIFKQVGDALTNEAKGTGLGLAISKEIVEIHGGRIWVESEPGQGTNFSFTIPAFYGHQKEIVTVDFEELVAQLNTPRALDSQAGNTILVVDDEEAIRNYLSQELSSFNYRVIEAASGLEAVKVVKDDRPDLIIMDILMLEMDGFKTIAAIRREPHMIDVPIVVVSVTEDKGRGYGLGIKQFMSKPIDAAALVANIERLLLADPAGQSVVVVDGVSSKGAELTKAYSDRGYQIRQADDLASGLSDATADIILVNAALLDQNSYLEKLTYRKPYSNGLILAYR